MSFLVILVSEIGDKTFIIAAVLAMRHSRLLIFSAAMSALAVMTLLSALAGSVFPSLISKLYTQLIVSILFLVFGMKMFKEASEMTGGEAQEELNQVSMELEKKSKDAQVQEALELGARSIRRKEEDVPQDELLLISDSPDDRLNMKSNDTTDASGRKMRDAQQRSSKKKKRSVLRRFKRVCLALVATVLSPIWIEAFVMTFLAEWGDRSQVATIALAGAEVLPLFQLITIGIPRAN